MPKSQCSRSPRWITGLFLYGLSFGRWIETDGWNQLANPSWRERSRIHHTTSSVVVTPGVITWFENASAMIA